VLAANPYLYPDFDCDAASYVTSKHALIGLTQYLAVRTGGTGVTANAISPEMFADTEANRHRCSEESRRRLTKFTSEGPTGDVGDLHVALTFLGLPGPGFVTGQNIVVDGGWTIWGSLPAL
jgi:meso-butanediol dehydrogenase / (S,S)-butanediol dehydrogenase / diacetyl reductase